MGEKTYDVAVFGATGFTGELTAEYLAANAPRGLRWAVAGRSRAKLEALQASLARIAPEAQPEIVLADVSEPRSLRVLAERTRVVITTVGPYITYGEPLVAACAETGTDYVDLTGEPEFVDRMWLRYHEVASKNGARLVHSCGFDSIPHDLGAYFCVKQLPPDVPLRVEAFVRLGGGASFSSGTYQSALAAMSRLPQYAGVAFERRRKEARPSGRRVRELPPIPHAAHGGGFAVPLPTIDPQVVLRSAAALEAYGPEFSYGHRFVVEDPARAAAFGAALPFALVLAQLPPGRKLLSDLGPKGGPNAERRARATFSVRFEGSGGGREVVCEVRGGDPGYGETAKMLAESALCLAFDELPSRAGQVTTAVAMGDALLARLVRAGIAFEVVA